ncbi:3'(2'),5'-bisphosphate nucleotidase CysQ [Sphingomicrobium clamense]|uniref:3'(2'),5'-bisphosphate nucleotidase CysQ n=1 Tax=Sphingomicrobium clamense TaxID=2851013 RepID=A0ABS6V546_9SPHN|nr:3'(2'),5'-bisphosphate nucleotidase CysQ [Sphingomicrobium sp. B8]MBW0144679.1 3'(2'),5'-bisphosphate nucleotidase CysQ [Sphingomicrobium sp. B8]
MTVASEALLESLGEAAREAGEAILEVVRRGFDVEHKGDDSPVTEADRAGEAVLLAALARHAPGVPVVAEEQVAAGKVPAHEGTFFLVDALDGTKEFIRGGDDYTVNVGLIENGVPSMGVIFSPAAQRLHLGLVGTGAWVEGAGPRRPIAVRELGDERVAVASKSHLSQETVDYLAQLFGGRDCERISIGSSLKFTLVAEGRADVYPRLSPTCEWDVAAGHAILLAAGGKVDGLDGQPLAYDKKAYFNPGFVATSGWQAPAIGPFMTPATDA